ncbi:MAG: hypothetical protein IJY28_09725 [Clostridia bacterium]|nr:hypothetical protein [Clostridia bacterium]
MEIIKRYLTRNALHHIVLMIPAVLMLILYGTSMNSQWWLYGVLFWVSVASVVCNVIAIILYAEKLVPRLYAIMRLLSFLLFIPPFCCTVLTVFFWFFSLFGIDFLPNNR